jgi:hypothetical protein
MVGLPPSGYRITAHDGPLASCGGKKQAVAPVGVSPMGNSGEHPDGRDRVFVSITRRQIPIVGSLTVHVR